MSSIATKMPHVLIVLRQVEGPRWCVVRHEVKNGRREFVARIASARDYAPACRIALEESKRAKLPLGIEAVGRALRPFVLPQDMPARGIR